MLRYQVTEGSQESSVGITTGCGVDSQSSYFLFSIVSGPALEPTEPPIQWVPGALSLEVKRQGREADHSPPTSVEVKNGGAGIFPLPHVFMT
jgi:hypothetical protein